MHSIISRPDLRVEELPEQDMNVVLLMGDRYTRASQAMESWATTAKKAIDYVEGRQWTEAELKKAEEQSRPALTFNKVGALMRLILGYHRNNRVDIKYLPDDAGIASEAVASGLTKLVKRISENNQEPYIDTEVFMDGLFTGRGYYDHRLDFSNNLFGEMKITARDPHTVKLDPDGESYDINETCTYVQEDRWVSIEEIELTYGRGAAAMVYPLVFRSGYSGMPASVTEYVNAVMPWRTFGGRQSADQANFAEYWQNCYDPARKNIRIVDCQHKVKVWRRFIVDLDTGDMVPVPDDHDDERLKKMLLWAQAQHAKVGKPCPLRVIHRLSARLRWTTMVGDMLVYDKWSPYNSFTMTPFFPYFRRGATKGAVEDLFDSQDEINKRRSANIDIVTRTAHSGWKYHEKGLDPEQQVKLENYGAAPGINIKWKGEPHMEPRKIEASAPPMAFERLELHGQDDLREISGINKDLLGMDDTVKSGRAIEARQRQGVMAIQMYMDNMSRTKELGARKKLEIIQTKYTQKRVYLVIGEQGKPEPLALNDRLASGQIINDVTLGKYKVSIDETPLSASFAAGQFEEAMEIIEKGVVPKEIMTDIIIESSSLPHKDAIKKRAEMMQKAMGLPTIDELESGALANSLILGPDGQTMPVAQPPALPAAQPQAQPA